MSSRKISVAELEQELEATKQYLQLTIKEHEATHDELEAANEELLASNAELQIINEELEAAKVELEATNEALTTANDALEHQNLKLSQLTVDLRTLLDSVDLPIVMLSHDLRIRHFTAQITRVMNLIPSDIGRRIGDIQPKINVHDLEPLLAEVIATAAAWERDVQDEAGRCYSMRIRPYRSAEDRIDGAVLCLIDVDARRGSRPG